VISFRRGQSFISIRISLFSLVDRFERVKDSCQGEIPPNQDGERSIILSPEGPLPLRFIRTRLAVPCWPSRHVCTS